MVPKWHFVVEINGFLNNIVEGAKTHETKWSKWERGGKIWSQCSSLVAGLPNESISYHYEAID
jgi:hypothetical protein